MKVAAALLLFTFWITALARGAESKRATPGRTTASQTTPDHIRFDVRQTLGTSAAVLLDLIRPGNNPIPVAVLNNTRCAVFINSKGAAEARGVVSCRLSPNQWSGPAFISLHQDNRAEASKKRELLVLLVSNKAQAELLGGRVHLGTRPASLPGPLVSRQANMKDSDITADTFTYDRRAGALKGEALDGVVSSDDATNRAFYPAGTDFRQVLSGHAPVPRQAASYVTAVASFFNTITPVGIIIHHSATLPSNHRVPKTEGEVDRFHEKRGFAVACFGKVYHVAYHYFILPNGAVKAGRPENCQGAHARGYNSYLGISLAGDFSSADNRRGRKGPTRPSNPQMKSLEALTTRLMHRYHIPVQNVLRHSDVSNTRCPGDRFPFSHLVAHLKRSTAQSGK
jgi:lipid-binding SYLF domain-containing protein